MKDKTLILIGFFIWLIFVILRTPDSFFQINYVHLLILAAPLWIIPMAWKLTTAPKQSQVLLLPTAILFSAAFLVEKGWSAVLLTLPWVLLVVGIAILQLKKSFKKQEYHLSNISDLAAFLYLPIGAAWAIPDRLGIPILGYDATIITLTIAHFHYAGFVLPILTAQLAKYYPQYLPKWIAWGVILEDV